MVKKLVFCLVTFFLLMQIVSAVDTEIKVKTLPDHEVQLTILYAASSSSVLESFKNNSDEYGDITFVYSSDKAKFGLILFVKKDGEKIVFKKYTENFIVGTPVYLELAPAWFEFIETPVENVSEESLNETIGNITSDENESEVFMESEEASEVVSTTSQQTYVQLAGSAIFGDKGFFTKKTIYYTIGILVLLIGFFAIKTMRKKLDTKEGINTTGVPRKILEKNFNKGQKLNDFGAEKKEKIKDNKEIIEDAEEKIKEAQEDIRKIKNQDKIKQAKKKIIEDEKELMRLREGKE